MSRADEIAARLADVRRRISDAERKAGRAGGSVTLVAVGKTYPIEDLLAAHAAGARAFGENRVQEAEAKFPLLPSGCARHLIGPIQSNKANRAAKLADVVETLDSEDLAKRLDRAAAAEGRTLEVFVQVRLGGEATKSGVDPKDAPALVEAVKALAGLHLKGLMTIPPPGEGRRYFSELRELAARVAVSGLSMGMSDDFEDAIAEGATHVRVGSAIFGERRREFP